MRAVNLVWKGLTIAPARFVRQGARVTWLWLYEKFIRLRDGVSPAETSRVTDRLFVGGQHYERGLGRMKSLGIGATVNLREEADDSQRGVAFQRHLWLPTPDDGAPTIEQLREGVAFIRASLAAGTGVYVHCAQGVGRAPTMAAAYLVSEGHSPREAMEAIRAARPFITPTPVQMSRLDEWARSMKNDKRQMD
ncbi:MAG TPA: dual specificity protein phosphatase [Anaerolineales bacterium]|nr:dual specificity protein phosphatase [Anaerolineales bacterium]